jgi:cyclopropane-fatty-acyl-phospholipid synthase
VTTVQHLAGPAIDPARWPDIATTPGSAVRAAIARALLRAAVARLPVRVRLPDGRGLGAGWAAAPVMVLHHPDAFFARLGAGGLIGFGESYMAGEWDCADLTGLLLVFAAHVGDLVPGPLRRARRLAAHRSRPAGAPGCRRSRCRMSACWPAGAPIPGSRSTSSPAA